MKVEHTPLQAAERLVELTKNAFDYVKVHASHGTSREVEVRNGTTEETRFAESMAIRVVAVRDKRTVTMTSTDVSEDGLAMVARSLNGMIGIVEQDRFSMVPEKEWMGCSTDELELFDQRIPLQEPADMAAVAQELESEALARDDRLISTGASYSLSELETAFSCSYGISMRERESHASMGISLAVPDGSATGENVGRRQRNGWSSSACNLEDLADVTEVADRAVERTLDRIGARKPVSGRFPVVLDPVCSGTFFGAIARAVGGPAVYRNESFLSGALNKVIAVPALTIDENPGIVRGLGSRRFDADGVLSRPLPVVQSGVLQNFLLGVYAARRLGLAPNGCAGGHSNFVVHPGHGSISDLIADMNTGIVVTGMMGQGADIRTGDFSMGAEGFLVQNGRITAPISEFTISSSFQEMLFAIERIGDDARLDTTVRSPSILLGQMTVAGDA